ADRLAAAHGRDRDDLVRAATAWRYGGAAGPAVLDERWEPDPAAMARARARIAAVWEADAPELVVDGNRLTSGARGVELRQGRDGRWWPYRGQPGGWWPAGPPEADPATALGHLLSL
ncbi:SWF or SNF family helicase, partial [Streptomyces sp. B1866]|nr:SWF or SNF family helicase [Streptomyces sp. B1866]